jgi:hypothetical protein
LNGTRDLVLRYVLVKKDKFPFKTSSMNGIFRDYLFDIRKDKKGPTYNPG